jgi:mobilization protein NikA
MRIIGVVMSGSETRQRQNHEKFRVTDAERAEIRARADRAGVTVASYIRATVLGTPPPRQSRRPPVNVVELARVLAALGKLGSNVNQMARVANSGGWPGDDQITFAAFAIHDMRLALMSALGVTPGENRKKGGTDD